MKFGRSRPAGSQNGESLGRVAQGLLEGTRATSKDDCADMVVTMCRTETMTGQTTVIDSGRYFH